MIIFYGFPDNMMQKNECLKSKLYQIYYAEQIATGV